MPGGRLRATCRRLVHRGGHRAADHPAGAFEQAGIIAAASFGELLDAAVLLASQPIPAGNAVAIVSTRGAAGCSLPMPARQPAWSWPRRARRLAAACATCCRSGHPCRAGGHQRGRQPGGFGEALHIAATDGVTALIAVVVRSASAVLLPVLAPPGWRSRSRGGARPAEAVRLLPGKTPARPSRVRLPGSGQAGPARAAGTAHGGPGRIARCRSSPTCERRTRARLASFLVQAGRRVVVRRGRRRSAALLRHPHGAVSPGRRR